MKHPWQPTLLSSLAIALAGCTHHTVDVQPIRVEPIHLTVDVNVKVDRELDRFFDFEDQASGAATQPAATPSPATQVSPATQGVAP